MKKAPGYTIEGCITGFPLQTQKVHEEMRSVIKASVPAAAETISGTSRPTPYYRLLLLLPANRLPKANQVPSTKPRL